MLENKPKQTVREESRTNRNLNRRVAFIATLLAVALSAYAIWVNGIGNLLGFILDNHELRSIFLGLALSLVFISYPINKKFQAVTVLDWALVLVSILTAIYMYANAEQFQWRLGAETTLDLVMGFLAILLVIEGCRRVIGPVLPAIAIIFVIYAMIGQYLPKVIGHGGFSFSRAVGHLSLTTEGIYGQPLGVAATYVVLFIIFGAFLQVSGAGQAFIDLAFAAFGRVRGGPAKVAVVASGLFGSINGSAVANVVGTGAFTIPLMKRLGYKPEVAGAIEAVSSTGGQIMPPVMGATAFIMAEMMGVPYLLVMVSAIIPAVLYFFSEFVQVDLEAARLGLSGVPREELPRAVNVLASSWHVMLAPILLVYLMIGPRYSALTAAFWSMVVLIVTAMLLPNTRLSVHSFLQALENGGRGVLEVAMGTACAGIVVGVFSLTGLGSKLSSALIMLSHGQLWLLLILTMISSIILGMGMPTTGAYIILAVLVVPPLIKMQIAPMAAHMFIFYFGAISAITPPVALASFAGAAIAGADPWKTGWKATEFGLAAFLVPYLFMYRKGLLLMGSPEMILWDVALAILGLWAFGIGLRKHFCGKLFVWQRAIMVGIGIALVVPNMILDIVGVVTFALMLLILVQQGHRSKTPISQKVG
ncbi:MAG: TRAP transporter permease [Bacillota bacterium]